MEDKLHQRIIEQVEVLIANNPKISDYEIERALLRKYPSMTEERIVRYIGAARTKEIENMPAEQSAVNRAALNPVAANGFKGFLSRIGWK